MDKHKAAEKSKDRSKQNVKEEKLAELATKIDETDEMKLKMLGSLEKPEPDDLLYPPELNAHLIDQLKVGIQCLFFILVITNCLHLH